MSPILSALYILPLLHITEAWRFRSLSTYVDDGAIVAMGASHKSVIDKCANGFYMITDWLLCNGLRIDPDKTEFITFQPLCADPNRLGTPCSHIDLQVPGGRTL